MIREEKTKMKVCVFNHEFDVYVPKGKEQLYLLAAENVNKRIDAYMDVFVRIPLRQKCYAEILLMAMLDIAVRSLENKFRYKLLFLFVKLRNTLKS